MKQGFPLHFLNLKFKKKNEGVQNKGPSTTFVFIQSGCLKPGEYDKEGVWDMCFILALSLKCSF